MQEAALETSIVNDLLEIWGVDSGLQFAAVAGVAVLLGRLVLEVFLRNYLHDTKRTVARRWSSK